MLRVIVTGILAEYWNLQIAEGFLHEFTGIIVFGTAVLMLILTGLLVNKVIR
jgi:exosortase/archaeosortase family protein